MSWFSVRPWLLLAPLALGLGCGGVQVGSGSTSDGTLIIQAQYEKPTLTPSGFSGVALKPARYCFAEVRRSSDGALLADGYLGTDGRGSVDLAPGTTCYVRLFSAMEVPATSGTGFFFRGSVMNGAAPPLGATDTQRANSYQTTPDWTLETNNFTVNGTLTADVVAHAGASDDSAGAFAIADQMATLAEQVRALDPTLRLPNLHTYWTTTSTTSLQRRAYPSVLFNGSSPYKLASGRAVFTAALYGQPGGAPNIEGDQFDDGVVQETLNHLLFADYSYKEDGSSAYSLLRRDNDPVFVSRTRPSESTAAFVGGFSDFLAAAATGDARLMDSYNNGSGILRVETFDLSTHSQPLITLPSEFTRGSVGICLWGTWKRALGGTQSGLQLLWNAVRSRTDLGDGTGEYERATLGCFPSYLLGVKARVTGTQWAAVLTELAAETIPDPNPAYFTGTALWLPITLGSTATASVQTYAPDAGGSFDRDQSLAFRFTQTSAQTRTITMTPTSGQDLYLEVLGPDGLWGGSYSNPGAPRTLTLTNLPAGVYAIRVRASYDTTATMLAGFNLTLN